MYIGQTNNVIDRWKHHTSKSSKNTIINRAIKKYGKSNFDFRIIQISNNHKDILDMEIYWIAFYKTNIHRYGDEYGYNLTDGGEGQHGAKRSAETRKKISEVQKGRKASEETKMAMSKSHIGQIVSEETRQKIAISNTGKNHTDEVRQKMSMAQIKRCENENNTKSKLNIQKVIEIRNILKNQIKTKIKLKDIAKMYGIDVSVISDIRDYKTWKNVKPEEKDLVKIGSKRLIRKNKI